MSPQASSTDTATSCLKENAIDFEELGEVGDIGSYDGDTLKDSADTQSLDNEAGLSETRNCQTYLGITYTRETTKVSTSSVTEYESVNTIGSGDTQVPDASWDASSQPPSLTSYNTNGIATLLNNGLGNPRKAKYSHTERKKLERNERYLKSLKKLLENARVKYADLLLEAIQFQRETEFQFKHEYRIEQDEDFKDEFDTESCLGTLNDNDDVSFSRVRVMLI